MVVVASLNQCVLSLWTVGRLKRSIYQYYNKVNYSTNWDPTCNLAYHLLKYSSC